MRHTKALPFLSRRVTLHRPLSPANNEENGATKTTYLGGRKRPNGGSHGSFLRPWYRHRIHRSCTASHQTKHASESLVRAVGSELTGYGHDLATRMHVVHHLLLQPAHVLLQPVHHGAELGVLALEQLNLVLEPGNPLELAPAALGRRDTVPLTFPLQLDSLLVLHVDR